MTCIDSVKNKERIKALIYNQNLNQENEKEIHVKGKQVRRNSRNTFIKGKMLRPRRTWLKRLCTKGRQDYNNQEIEKQSRRTEARHKNKERAKKKTQYRAK